MSCTVLHETVDGPMVLEMRSIAEPHAGPGEVRITGASRRAEPLQLADRVNA